MLMLRARQGNKTIGESGGPDAERNMIELALRERNRGAVTIQRQQRQASPNPDGKWYWKRHMLFEQFP